MPQAATMRSQAVIVVCERVGRDGMRSGLNTVDCTMLVPSRGPPGSRAAQRCWLDITHKQAAVMLDQAASSWRSHLVQAHRSGTRYHDGADKVSFVEIHYHSLR